VMKTAQRGSLCIFHLFQSERIRSQLYCWQDLKTQPAFKILPLKVEMLSIAPLLLRFHDFISKAAAEEITDVGDPQFGTSFSDIIGHQATSRWQHGYQTNFNYTGCRVASRILFRVNQITKLDVQNAKIHVTSNNFGSEFPVHHDSVCPRN